MEYSLLLLALYLISSVVGVSLTPQNQRYKTLSAISLVFYTFLVKEKIILFLIYVLVIYWGARRIEKYPQNKKIYYFLLFLGLSPLIFFKVFHEWKEDMGYFIGLSFFTFNGISYLVDVKRGYIRAYTNFSLILSYLVFLPHILAGPLHRAKYLIKQFESPIQLSDANFSLGLRLVLWGVFKNYVLAQRFKYIVDSILNYPDNYTGVYVWLGGLLFFFQIYCDFSSYIDIGRGIAQIFGLELKKNFENRVYLASSRVEFWQGWHITLNHWFRDYFFFPLAKGITQKWKLHTITLFTFLMIGLWHGITIQFACWGLVNGVWIILERTISFRLPKNAFSKMLGVVYHLFFAAWIALVFRVSDVQKTWRALWVFPQNSHFEGILLKNAGVAMLVFIWMDYFYLKAKNAPIENYIGKQPAWIRWGIYSMLIFLILLLGVFPEEGHYYFKF